MNWDPIIHWIAGLAASAIVAAVGRWMSVKVDESQRQKLTWAIEQGVAYAALKLGKAHVTGAEKQQAAIETARSLAPSALKKVDEEKLPVLVDAVYARMKTSLPEPSFHLDRGTDIPVDVVLPPPGPLSERPTPLPLPKKVKLPS